MTEPTQDGAASVREYLAAWIGYAVAAFVLLYPIFTRGLAEVYSPLLHLSRPIAKWVMWILAWDTHALTGADSLFGANVFHPAPEAMAFADPLLGLLPLFAPVYLLTSDPVIAYQWTLLATIAMCGAGMFCLARQWGAGIGASAIAGLVYAYCPARVGVLGEMAYVSLQYLPLALLFTDRLARRWKGRDAVLLVFFASLQVLCGTQLAYVSLIVLAVYALAGCVLQVWEPMWQGLAAAALALVASLSVLAAITSPYRALVAGELFTGGSMRELASAASADIWRMYLVQPYFARTSYDGALYVGITVLALVALAAVGSGVRPARKVLQLVVVAGVCYWMSLGLGVGGGDLSLYGLVLEALPGFEMLGPPPARFAPALMIAVAGLAAFGVDVVLHGRGAKATALATAGICLIVLIDYRLPFQRFDTQRVLFGRDELPLYADLAALADGPVLEMPMQTCGVRELATAIDRQLGSALHWKPLLDGYRNQWRAPSTYEVVRGIANALPDPRALRLLRRSTGLRYVVVHLADLPGDWRHRWRRVDGMTRLGFYGHDLLFEVEGEVEADLADDLLSLPRSEQTLTGTGLAKLVGSQRDAKLSFSRLPPRTARVGAQVRAELLVENLSDAAWPALTTDSERKLYVSYLWADRNGGLAGGNPRAQPLPIDLGPGESVVVPVCVGVPAKTGGLDLSFGITQGGDWFDEFTERVAISVVRPRTEFWTAADE